ncbi:nucleotidyltransferase domain-containing protein [Jiangella alba]|uniref:Nucleotidyltransferase domain-containing protein n=1 Tax=Jiangella alba TaxID=561176 RepID=A0A1H5PEB4_9ACTN|nr:nucleotidyltransferase domain-containing protein [Jiangella alba]SEF12030.1 Nucleotidyltransferase domain-containing protein [Jiangella alba]
MDWSDPATAVMSHGTAAVIRALSGARSFGVRELAGVAGVSPTRARQVVQRLAEHGLVEVDAHPGAHLVRLNLDHLAVQPTIALAHLRTEVLHRLGNEVNGWPLPAEHVSLFGSAARGDGNTYSDIDLLVVRPSGDQEAWDHQLADSGAAIRRWTGNWVSWFEVEVGGLQRMAAEEEPIVDEWCRDAILLRGRSLNSLLRRTP